MGGGLEHILLGAIPREATLLAHLRRSFPNVLDVHLSLGGVGRYHLYVRSGSARRARPRTSCSARSPATTTSSRSIVVDDDVDIHDPTEVEWAVATRFQADQDLVIVPNSQGSRLDPSTRDGVGAKMGLDATKPLAADEMTVQAHPRAGRGGDPRRRGAQVAAARTGGTCWRS